MPASAIYDTTGVSYNIRINPVAAQWIAIPHSLSGNTLDFFRTLIMYKLDRCDVIGYQDPLSGDYKIFDVNSTGASSGMTADLQYVPPPGSPIFVRLISSGDNPSGKSVPLSMSGEFYPYQTYSVQEWKPSGIGTWVQLPPYTTAASASDLASSCGMSGVLDVIWLQDGEEQRWPTIDGLLDAGIGYCIRTSDPVIYEQTLTTTG